VSAKSLIKVNKILRDQSWLNTEITFVQVQYSANIYNSTHQPVVGIVTCPTELILFEVVTVALDDNGVLLVVDELVDIWYCVYVTLVTKPPDDPEGEEVSGVVDDELGKEHLWVKATKQIMNTGDIFICYNTLTTDMTDIYVQLPSVCSAWGRAHIFQS